MRVSHNLISLAHPVWYLLWKIRFITNTMCYCILSNLDWVWLLQYLQFDPLLGAITPFDQKLPTHSCLLHTLMLRLGGYMSILLSQGITASLMIDGREHVPISMSIRIRLIEDILSNDVCSILSDCSIWGLAFINTFITHGIFMKVSNDFPILIHRLPYDLGLGQYVYLPMRK